MLAGVVSSRTSAHDMSIELVNRVTIEIHTREFPDGQGLHGRGGVVGRDGFLAERGQCQPGHRGHRGDTAGDGDGAGVMLLAASSPYSRRGALWDAHRRLLGEGRSGAGLAGADAEMNPTIAQRVVDEALERDASVAGERVAGRRFALILRATSTGRRLRLASSRACGSVRGLRTCSMRVFATRAAGGRTA